MHIAPDKLATKVTWHLQIIRLTMRSAILLLVMVVSVLSSDPEAHMKVPEIIAHWGYPSESITVTTDDGYLLTMHRIPYGKNDPNPNKKRPIMFLQHGIEASSSSWVTNLPSLSLGFMAADAGFDVWMGNLRGNLYSIGHQALDTNKHPYWEFSWDQMEQHDLDTMINHALNATGHQDLYYVGHSQGTLIMFSKLAENPDFKNKIRQFHALAPIGTVKHIEGPLKFIADDLYYEAKLLLEIFGPNQFLPESGFVHLLSELFCKKNVADAVCDNILFLIMGPESHQLNNTRLPVYLADEPSGTSTQNIIHFSQMIRSGKQQRFDWGSKKLNEQKYGSAVPPTFDISKIETDMYLYWSDDDWLGDKKDIEGHLLPNLNPKFLKQINHISHFNHLDWIWGQRAGPEVYVPLLKTILADAVNRGEM